ncbi:RNA pyrophosphohydrolase [Xanthobacter sp. TB0136]|uniref:RNA pyrophosphohydrolase n=1 Tax=Xanthobacter sp. TB0136 TaxID=3459177 RepID=UPI0040390245
MSHQQEPLPYRPCVGLCLFNGAGKVFMGRRAGGADQIDLAHAWQLPQGGIDKGEDPYAAALRELYEETSVRSIAFLGEIEHWLPYDLPEDVVGNAWKGRYRGQTQKWFALRFTGDDSEINIHTPGGGMHKPEFVEWRWEELARAPDLIVPFKRDVYLQVARHFQPFAVAQG